MIKSLIRTIRGPSQDPAMAHVSRPLPRDLLDEQVVAAVRLALEVDPRPNTLVETLPQALLEVTGHEYQVLDRSVRDVTGAFTKVSVMIRDGDVGIWPGHAARAYPLLQPSDRAEQTRAAIVSADGSGATDAASPTNPVGKPGWAPPPPPRGEASDAGPVADGANEGEEPTA